MGRGQFPLPVWPYIVARAVKLSVYWDITDLSGVYHLLRHGGVLDRGQAPSVEEENSFNSID